MMVSSKVIRSYHQHVESKVLYHLLYYLMSLIRFERYLIIHVNLELYILKTILEIPLRNKTKTNSTNKYT